MSGACEQTERTLLWVYGELPDAEDAAHLAHVGRCASCQAVVAEHEAVGALLAGAASADAIAADPVEAPVQTSRSWGVPALALAAAALLTVCGAVWMASGPAVPPPEPVATVPELRDVARPAEPVADLSEPRMGSYGTYAGDLDALDADLDALDADLDALLFDLEDVDALDALDDSSGQEAP